MALAFVKAATGTSASSTVSWAFGSATTSGNLIVGCIAADDYNGTPDSGWTQSAEMEQQAYHGAYIWWRISTGQTSPQAYTIGSATNSAWCLLEFSGNDATPYDTSQGVIANVSTAPDEAFATDAIVPSAGQRLLVALLGGGVDSSLAAASIDTWTSSFTAAGTIGSGGTGTNNIVGCAYRIVTGDGSTSFSTSGACDIALQSHSGLIISFKEGGTSQSNAPRAMHHYRQRR